MAKSPRATIGLIFVGGSTLDGRDRDVTTVTKSSDIQPWLARMTEAEIIGDTVGWFVASGEQPIGPTDWSATVKTISDHYDEVDGFVVLHALESVTAGATALQLMLPVLGKPVVVVGSPLPAPHERRQGQREAWPTTKEYGAKASFINAIQVAISDVGEVVVVYGSHVFRGTSVIRRMTGERSRLDGQTLGKIDFGIRLFGEQVRRSQRPLKILPKIESRVTAIEFFPGMTADQIVSMASGASGVFLSSHESWHALQSALPDIAKRLPVPLGIYAPSQTTVPAGLIVPGVSRTTALVTFMWVLGQSTVLAQMKKKFLTIGR